MHQISFRSTDPVVRFAAEELREGLNRICDQQHTCALELGLFSDFHIVPVGKDQSIDDEIVISVENGHGYLAGSNARSVLFAVYRYLESCGVAWVRPGKNGTFYPSNVVPSDVSIREKASTRHRVVCIEGAVSIQNVLDMIDWLPKLGFNGYFIQFRTAYIFFDRWYAHRRSTKKQPEKFDNQTAVEYVSLMRTEIKKRGLLFHAIGHGWTCEPFGIFNYGWDPILEGEIPDSYRSICAQVNGVRDVWTQRPITTQLCYSNKAVRKKMNEGVLTYLRENPDVDVLHYWLGDYFNNYCECPECTKLHVSDYYVMMLNELDEMLVAEGLKTKIVFGISNNKGYAPIQERLHNPDRFILMFAPISRTFSEPFPKDFQCKRAPDYEINNFSMPRSVDELLGYLYEWEQMFSGDCVDFDYHLMWDHFLDAGGEEISKVIYNDLERLSGLGMNGYISCQLQRNTFPTSLAMTIMGKTLWNRNTDFDATRDELYCNAFGAEYLPILNNYFQTLSRGFNIGVLRSHKEIPKEKIKQNLEQAMDAMNEIIPVIAEQKKLDCCMASSWKLLDLHREIYSKVGQSLLARIDQRIEEADELLQVALEYVWQHEDEFANAMDAYFFQECITSRVSLEKPAEYMETL